MTKMTKGLRTLQNKRYILGRLLRMYTHTMSSPTTNKTDAHQYRSLI